jgi:hypothetical protein
VYHRKIDTEIHTDGICTGVVLLQLILIERGWRQGHPMKAAIFK